MRISFAWLAIALASCAAVSACNKSGPAKNAADSDIVARVGGEPITLQQLNAEIATVPSGTIQDPKQLQTAVLRAIAIRTAMRQAAVTAKLDRDPQLTFWMKAASDKLLSDAYLKQQSATVLAPTAMEVEQFVTGHPLVFADRRIYDFTQLSFPQDQYSDDMKPQFDEKPNFLELEAILKEKGIPFTETDVRHASSEFAQDAQDKLAQYKVGDNIVVKGGANVLILKIKSWVAAAVSPEQAREVAQSAIYRQSIQDRTQAVERELTTKTKIEYLGTFKELSVPQPTGAAAPEVPPKPAPAASGKPPTGGSP
jgi:EpsD family peptidyl-prolyl cis-trans isomerase